MDNLVLVNNNHSINKNYVPNDLESCDQGINLQFYYYSLLRKEANLHFLKLRKEALNKKYDIYVCSGFRSFKNQIIVFLNYFKKYYMELKEKFPYESDEKIKKDAFILTKKRVALPGKSEHQTGLAIDITCFYNGNYDEDISINNEVEWMKDNAHKFGFILRYPKGKEDITGYNFEPWHYRYVGNNYSYDITNDNLTLEEYYEIVLKK